MKFSGNDLTIVICAYKECPDLKKSIKSVLRQTVKSQVIISTSTPNDYINGIAKKYNIPVIVNPEGGHVKDYNFAMDHVKTRLGMIAHQDDLLHPEFVERNLKALNRASDPIISFSNYLEIHNGRIDRKPSMIVRVKRLIVWPMRIPFFRRTVAAKRLGQCFGDPITHPTVICVMNKMPEVMFREQYRASMDWDLWERLSKQKGEFVYVSKVLMFHRMSDDNMTAKLIHGTNARYDDEFEIMSRFWPKWFAKILMIFYSKSAKYY